MKTLSYTHSKMFVTVFTLLFSFCVSQVALASDSIEDSDVDLQVLQQEMLNIKSQPKVDLNHADAESIARVVKGIGEKRAEAIVTYREQNGPFGSFDELAQVSGISENFIDQHRKALEQHFILG